MSEESQTEGSVARIIDGKAISASIRSELATTVTAFKEKSGITPGLAVVLVGERRDSATYVRMKRKGCEEVGIASYGFDFPSSVTQGELIKCVQELNQRSDVHGILVQLPLPEHIEEKLVLDAIEPQKDVDGLHPINVAALSSGRTRLGGQATKWDLKSIGFPVACTPQGCIELLDRSGVTLEGKNAVVLGRSNIVGIPIALLLMHRDATVTIVHSKTQNPAEVVRNADIVVAAVGRAHMIKGDWIKQGAVVIDVGINSIDDASKKAGYRLVGDVDFEAAKLRASQITPVPGGVGPMTIAMLLNNTVHCAMRQAAISID